MCKDLASLCGRGGGDLLLRERWNLPRVLRPLLEEVPKLEEDCRRLGERVKGLGDRHF